MNKALFMTGATGYVLGLCVYVIVFVSRHWGDMDYVLYKTVEGASKGAAWPWLVLEWFVHGKPVM